MSMQGNSPSRTESMTIRYPAGLYWTTIVLALISVAIHIYFGVFVYTGTVVVTMFGIAAIFLVGVVLVLANFRRRLWIKVGAGWTVLLVVLWAATAFLGNYPHTKDPLAFVVSGVEIVLIISLLSLMRYSKVETSTSSR